METKNCALCALLGRRTKPSTFEIDQADDHARIHYRQLLSFTEEEVTMKDNIFRQCFPEVKSEVKREFNENERRQSLAELCRSIFGKQPKFSRAACNLCGEAVRLQHETSLRVDVIITHACSHLDVKMYECRHCDRSCSHNKSTVVNHIKNVHGIKVATRDDLEDHSGRYHDEIVGTMKRCFSNCKQASDAPEVTPGHRSLLELCRSVFAGRPPNSRATCNRCQLAVRATHNGAGQANNIIGHASLHLDTKIFKCLHCDHSFNKKASTVRHAKRNHAIVKPSNADFEDQSDKFTDEIRNMIKLCFLEKRERREEMPSKESITKIKGEINLRIRNGSTKLAAERQLLCYRLMKKAVDKKGKIKCRLCSKRVTIKNGDGFESQSPMGHIKSHLQLPLYQCIACSHKCCTIHTLSHHLRSIHALGLFKNYVCYGDKYHSKIMNMLSRCYGKKK